MAKEESPSTPVKVLQPPVNTLELNEFQRRSRAENMHPISVIPGMGRVKPLTEEAEWRVE